VEKKAIKKSIKENQPFKKQTKRFFKQEIIRKKLIKNKGDEPTLKLEFQIEELLRSKR